MTPDDFNFLCTAIKERSGLVLTREKAYLVESRLAPVARRWKKTLDEMISALRQHRDPGLLRDIVEAMATHETFFFRDAKPFEQFRRVVLPALVKARAGERRLRFWSAACSAGQEPYSLAMILKEEADLIRGWRVDIVATDLSNEILARAEQGAYSQFEVQRGLPVQLMVKYFRQVGERWQIDPAIRSAVSFSRQNLLEDFAGHGRFDVIFCRNVLIYFDQNTKSFILNRLAQQMAGDGYLFLGGAETILGLTNAFTSVPAQSGLFARADGSATSRPRMGAPGATAGIGAAGPAAASSTVAPGTVPGGTVPGGSPPRPPLPTAATAPGAGLAARAAMPARQARA